MYKFFEDCNRNKEIHPKYSKVIPLKHGETITEDCFWDVAYRDKSNNIQLISVAEPAWKTYIGRQWDILWSPCYKLVRKYWEK